MCVICVFPFQSGIIKSVIILSSNPTLGSGWEVELCFPPSIPARPGRPISMPRRCSGAGDHHTLGGLSLSTAPAGGKDGCRRGSSRDPKDMKVSYNGDNGGLPISWMVYTCLYGKSYQDWWLVCPHFWETPIEHHLKSHKISAPDGPMAFFGEELWVDLIIFSVKVHLPRWSWGRPRSGRPRSHSKSWPRKNAMDSFSAVIYHDLPRSKSGAGFCGENSGTKSSSASWKNPLFPHIFSR